MNHPQPVAARALEYQPPSDAAANPWVTVVRAVGWVAAAMSVAHLAAAACATVFEWQINGGNVSLDSYWTHSAIDGLLHVPALIGGVACARLRPYGWRLLVVALWVVLGSKGLLMGLSAASLTFGGFPASWVTPARAALIGQSVFALLGTAVPVGLMIWVLRRPAVRLVFDVPQQSPAR